MSPYPIKTETGSDLSGLRIEQLTLFLGDRLGALLSAFQLLTPDRIRICAVSMSEATDHAVVRLVVDRPATARALLEEEGYAVHHHDVLGVALPRREDRDVGIHDVLHALLSAEIKVNYVYALATRVDERAVLAMSVEDPDVAEHVLTAAGLELIDQAELGWGESSDE